MKHLSQEELILHYYGEPELQLPGNEVEEHLTLCETCRADYRSLQRVLNTVESLSVPERGPEYGTQVWRRIAPALGAPVNREKTQRAWWRDLLGWRNLSLAGAMATVVVVAFLAGRQFRQSPAPTQTADTKPARERILLVAMGAHLERSQMVLAELANAEPGKGGVDIAYEQRAAEDLVESNRLYRLTAASTGDTAAASLLDDLERVLLEVVHSPSEASAQDLTDLQKQIQDRGILFKVRVFASKVRERENKPALAVN